MVTKTKKNLKKRSEFNIGNLEVELAAIRDVLTENINIGLVELAGVLRDGPHFDTMNLHSNLTVVIKALNGVLKEIDERS